MLSFEVFRLANARRCREAFSCSDWTAADWIMATTGELGELANVLKKIRRGDFTLESMRVELGKEIADVVTYLDLLAEHLGIDLGQAVIDKFNEVSARMKSHITL